MVTQKGQAIAILKIQGMENLGRAKQLRRAAEKLDGVLRVDINYISETATIKYDADRLTLAEIKSLHHDEPHSAPPGVIVEPRGVSSRGPVRTHKYIQGKRKEGEINRSSRRRGRYSRTQRGRLGE
ncbi:MAG: heavy-metal-associated domain-containing protein [Nitrososphaerota archaeon]|nr:heavy-metal-associated domain-containing protein [Nitrososphaerota archaeon]MDG7025273.1 heavy-metal-associated domain-containing protein [Nitrososphaerota archaeon]